MGVKQFREDRDRRTNLAREQFLQETKPKWITLGLKKEEDSDLLQSVEHREDQGAILCKEESEEEDQLAEKACVCYQD